MVNGEAGDLTARAVLLVNQELTSEQELAMDRNTGVKIALETTKNQRFATLVSNVQLMANGEVGDLTARAVLLANLEHNSEHENVKEYCMVGNTALEITKNQKPATPTSTVQLMANGETGDLIAHAVLLVNQELNSEQELARERNMEVKIAPEMINKQRFVTPRSTVQSTENGEAGDPTAHAALLVIQELNSEQELAREKNMEVKTVQELTNKQRFATPRSTVQLMVNGEAGDLTAHAVLHVNQELN